ncbi:complement factor D-like [Arapaima gigas]
MCHQGGVFSVLLVFASSFFHQGGCITGGTEATPHSKPYMASVQVNGRHECGGFLIQEQWVMSAAHCFGQGTEGVKIVLGAHSLKQPEETKQEFTISQVHSHPNFNRINYDNDIALVKLDRPAVMTDAVKVVEFNRAGGVEPGVTDEVNAAGWGSTNNRGARPDNLLEVFVEVMDPKLCSRSDYYGTKFTDNMLCAARRQKDTCDGDSGGPLLYNGIAVGVTSNGGKKCGSSRKPGVYTIISHFTTWIDNTMQG